MSYQTLWAAPWLRDVAGLDSAQVANGLFLFNIGFLCGVFGSGALADAALRRGIPPVWGVIFAIFGTLTVEAMFAMNATAIALPLCFAFGCFGSAASWSMRSMADISASLAGRTNSAQNMLSFVVAFVLQWGIGEIVGCAPRWLVAATGGGASGGYAGDARGDGGGGVWLVWPRRGAGRLECVRRSERGRARGPDLPDAPLCGRRCRGVPPRRGAAVQARQGAAARRLVDPGRRAGDRRTVFEAGRRELAEETGIDAEIFALVDVIDAMSRDEDGRDRMHYTLVDVVGEWRAGEAAAADDVAEVMRCRSPKSSASSPGQRPCG